MSEHNIKLKLNGKEFSVTVGSEMTLLSFLRDEMNLMGTKEGCGTGDCGACTVLLDGKAVNSCLLFAVEADGRSIMTIEGLTKNGVLHPLQQAFVDHGAIQCGFCTPGMIMNAYSLLKENPDITEDEIKLGLAGNICRCTGYVKIIDAVLIARKHFTNQ